MDAFYGGSKTLVTRKQNGEMFFSALLCDTQNKLIINELADVIAMRSTNQTGEGSLSCVSYHVPEVSSHYSLPPPSFCLLLPVGVMTKRKEKTNRTTYCGRIHFKDQRADSAVAAKIRATVGGSAAWRPEKHRAPRLVSMWDYRPCILLRRTIC